MQYANHKVAVYSRILNPVLTAFINSVEIGMGMEDFYFSRIAIKKKFIN